MTGSVTYPNVLRALMDAPWAIQEEKLTAMLGVLSARLTGEQWSPEEIRGRLEAAGVVAGAGPNELAAAVRATGPVDKVKVIPIYGMIAPRLSAMAESSGGVSLRRLRAEMDEAMMDSSIKAIVLDIDSPGGTVQGTPEFAAYLMKAREDKRIVAQANGLAASAAYWLMAASSEAVVTPSGQVGSLGVFAIHTDVSKALEREGVSFSVIKSAPFKAEMMPYFPLSDEARVSMQARVDELHEMFVADVAKGRGVTKSVVNSSFGQGRVVGADAAKAANMVDRIGTLEETLARLGVGATGVGNVSRVRAAALARTLAREEMSH